MLGMVINLALFIWNLIWMSIVLDSTTIDTVSFIFFIIFAILAICSLIEAILSGVEYKINKMKKEKKL